MRGPWAGRGLDTPTVVAVRRLVALRALGLGDLLTAVPALRGLRRGFADHRIELLVPRAPAPLVLRGDLADRVIPTRGLRALPPEAGGADVAVNLHGRGPHSHRLLLDGSPGRLLAYARSDVPESVGGPLWQPKEYEPERWARLVRAFGMAADAADLDVTVDYPAGAAALAARWAGCTVLHPGASSGARRWPVGRWVEVARHEHRQRRKVVITGSVAERPLAEAVCQRARVEAQCCMAGETSILELAALVQHAGRVVCGDTGVAHLATAMGTPSVVLFGPSSPQEWGPHRAGAGIASCGLADTATGTPTDQIRGCCASALARSCERSMSLPSPRDRTDGRQQSPRNMGSLEIEPHQRAHAVVADAPSHGERVDDLQAPAAGPSDIAGVGNGHVRGLARIADLDVQDAALVGDADSERRRGVGHGIGRELRDAQSGIVGLESTAVTADLRHDPPAGLRRRRCLASKPPRGGHAPRSRRLAHDLARLLIASASLHVTSIRKPYPNSLAIDVRRGIGLLLAVPVASYLGGPSDGPSISVPRASPEGPTDPG